ncbi:MAG: hypothetical protein C0605_17630 [Hyphomicrobiales bacterium]|jgi:hypothetical protein|nr:MAG: hypothetical protein C0605_17630 [Hyphomicrobiales bacterium]
MKVSITHEEKSQGLVFKKTLHGVKLSVQFNDEETAIIEERNLKEDIIIERGAPADVDAEKHANRGLVKMVATAAIKGRDANHFHLTINRLMNGPDLYFFETPLEAKEYEMLLKEKLPEVKEYIMGNQEMGEDSSFEL